MKTEMRVQLSFGVLNGRSEQKQNRLVMSQVRCDASSNVSTTFEPIGFSFYGEFDPGSGRTLAACLIHASRAKDIEVLAL